MYFSCSKFQSPLYTNMLYAHEIDFVVYYVIIVILLVATANLFLYACFYKFCLQFPVDKENV